MEKKRIILLHALGWMALPLLLTFIRWVFQFAVVYPGGPPVASFYKIWADHLELNTALVLIGLSSFYLTYLFLAPALRAPARKWPKILMYIALLAICPFVVVALMSLFSEAAAFFFGYFLFFAFIVALGFVLTALLLSYLQNGYQTRQNLAKIEKQKLEVELELIKARLNPHFLFNTLNNIDTLVLKDPPLASKYLNELAGLLRFMLYGVSEERIALQKEIAHIERYIALERIRSVNPAYIHFTVQGDTENRQVVPLLFMPLVENAIKHASDKRSDGSVNVAFEISPAAIALTCRNRYSASPSSRKGIGLEIMKQRLALLYPQRHHFAINAENQMYEVHLKIDAG